MKILYVSSSIIPSNSANSVHVMKMCQAFAKNGHEVTLLGVKGKDDADPYSFYNVDNVFELNLTERNSKFMNLSIIYRVFASIKSAKDAEIIYSRWALAALILTKLTKKRIIFEYHHLPKGTINEIIESLLIKSNNVIQHVFITNALKKDYIKKFPSLRRRRTKVLPDGADIISDLVTVESKRKKLECVYIGSFYKGKGVDIVVEIAKQMPKNVFHIVGGSNEEVNDYKSRYNGGNIKWYGFLSQVDAMNVLKNADIALLPNQKEIILGDNKTNIGDWTSPMKLFEYMSYGKAIISSDLSVLKEILSHRENALLVSPDNINDWIWAIQELQNNKNLFKTISINAREDLETKYSWKIRANNVLEITQ